MKYKGLFYLNIVLTVGVIAKDTRIIGGTNADAREFPYTVSLRDISINIIFCGGVIVSHRHILTTARCSLLKGKSLELVRIYTVITSPRSVIGPSFKIDKVYIHPSFTGHMTLASMNVNDISVIKVVETIEFNEFQNMIDLPTEYVPDGVDCIMTGWGSLTHPVDTIPVTLQKALITIIDRVRCVEPLPFILHQGHLCGILKEGMSAAEGDGGGPLACNNKLVGIVSLTAPYSAGYPDIFMEIHYYLDFIISTMSNDS